MLQTNNYYSTISSRYENIQIKYFQTDSRLCIESSYRDLQKKS